MATKIYSDNYFPVLPGTEKKVIVEINNDKQFKGTRKVQFELEGWNIKAKKVGEELELTFK